MRIDIITVLPEMLEGFVHESILARAEKKGLAEIHLHNLRDYTKDKWRRVDDYPYGGFAGMVMQCEPIDNAISALKAERDYDDVIYVTPDGARVAGSTPRFSTATGRMEWGSSFSSAPWALWPPRAAKSRVRRS